MSRLTFSDVAKHGTAIPYKSTDEWFTKNCMGPVARGEITIEEAWSKWLEHCQGTGKKPVDTTCGHGVEITESCGWCGLKTVH